MFQLVQSGADVAVFTVMAGAMPADVEMSSFIEEHIIRWQLGPNPVPSRRAEDQRSVTSLGATITFGDVPDALFRTDGQGNALYPDLTRLFGPVHPDDPGLREKRAIVARATGVDVLYVPLGAGGHIDHRLVRDAVLERREDLTEVAVFFYEEYPYSADGDDIIDAARDAVGYPLEPVVHPLSDAALDAKINAIACHESQISTFWGDVEVMTAAVREYAQQVGLGAYAERFWKFT